MSGYESNKRWRKKYPLKWLAMKKRYYRQFQESLLHSCNKGLKWTLEEKQFIMSKFFVDRIISSMIGRSVGAIQAARGRIKKQQDE